MGRDSDQPSSRFPRRTRGFKTVTSLLWSSPVLLGVVASTQHLVVGTYHPATATHQATEPHLHPPIERTTTSESPVGTPEDLVIYLKQQEVQSHPTGLVRHLVVITLVMEDNVASGKYQVDLGVDEVD